MKETKELVIKAKKGDKESLALLIKNIKSLLYKTAFTYLKDKDMALDAFAETSYRICERLIQLRKPESFKSWAMSMLVNICREQIRINKKTVRLQESNIPVEQYEMDNKSILRIQVADALDKLSEKHREVIILRYYSDLEIKEIARVLDVKDGTVKSRIYYAIKELETYFKDMDVEAG